MNMDLIRVCRALRQAHVMLSFSVTFALAPAYCVTTEPSQRQNGSQRRWLPAGKRADGKPRDDVPSI
jgi:hypothetical protein